MSHVYVSGPEKNQNWPGVRLGVPTVRAEWPTELKIVVLTHPSISASFFRNNLMHVQETNPDWGLKPYFLLDTLL